MQLCVRTDKEWMLRAASRAGVDFDLTTSVGHLVRRAGQRYAAAWTSLVPRGLTSPQFSVLAILDSDGSLDQQTLGERAGLDKSTCGDVIDRMRRSGLVHTDVDPQNRRRKLVSLTDVGSQRLVDTLPFQREVQESALARLSHDERVELRRLLLKLLNLQR